MSLVKTLTLRLSEADHRWFSAVAEQMRTPLTVLLRQQLVVIAKESGVPQPSAGSAATRQPPKYNGTASIDARAFGAAIAKHIADGEDLKSVARSYGFGVDYVGSMLQKHEARVKEETEQEVYRLQMEARHRARMAAQAQPTQPTPAQRAQPSDLDSLFDDEG
jgi:hypothetical protein